MRGFGLEAIVAATLTAGVLRASGAVLGAESWRQTYRRAQQAYDAGDLRPALNGFQDSLRLAHSASGASPADFAEILGRIARCWEELGRLGEAARVLEAARKTDPASYWVDVRLAQVYVEEGRLHEAKRAIAEAKANMGPRVAEEMIAQGYDRFEGGDNHDAQADFQAVADLGYPAGHCHLGALYYRRGRLVEAERELMEALRLARASPSPSYEDIEHAIMWLGRILPAQGAPAAARVEPILRQGLAEAYRVPHGCAWAVLNRVSLARAEAAQGRIAEAEADFRGALRDCEREGKDCEYEESAMAKLHWAAFLERQGRLAQARSEALDAWNIFLRAPPEKLDPDIFLDLGKLLERLEEADKAASVYRVLLRRCRGWKIVSVSVIEGRLADLDKTGQRP